MMGKIPWVEKLKGAQDWWEHPKEAAAKGIVKNDS